MPVLRDTEPRHAGEARSVLPEALRTAYVVKKVELATAQRLGISPAWQRKLSHLYSHVLRIYDNAFSIDVLLKREYCEDAGVFQMENDYLEIEAIDYGKLIKLTGIELRLLQLTTGSMKFVLLARKIEFVNSVSTNVTGKFLDASTDPMLAKICSGSDRFYMLNMLSIDGARQMPDLPDYNSETDMERPEEMKCEALGRRSVSQGPNCASPGSHDAPRPSGSTDDKASSGVNDDHSGKNEKVSGVACAGGNAVSAFAFADVSDNCIDIDMHSQHSEIQSGNNSQVSHIISDATAANCKDEAGDNDGDNDGDNGDNDDDDDDDNDDDEAGDNDEAGNDDEANGQDDTNGHDEEAGSFVQYDVASSSSSPLRSCSSELLSAASSRSNCLSSNSQGQPEVSKTNDFLRMALLKSLSTFFEQHDREFLPNIESLINRYFGRSQTIEEDINRLFDFVQDKYKARPCAIVIGNNHEGGPDHRDENLGSSVVDVPDGNSKTGSNDGHTSQQGGSINSSGSIGCSSNNKVDASNEISDLAKRHSVDGFSNSAAEEVDGNSHQPSENSKTTFGSTQVAPWNADYDPNFECSQASQSQALISSDSFLGNSGGDSFIPSSDVSSKTSNDSKSVSQEGQVSKRRKVESREGEQPALNVMDPRYEPFKPKKRAKSSPFVSSSGDSSVAFSFRKYSEKSKSSRVSRVNQEAEDGEREMQKKQIRHFKSSARSKVKRPCLWNQARRTAWVRAQPKGLAYRAFSLVSGDPNLYKSVTKYMSEDALSEESFGHRIDNSK